MHFKTCLNIRKLTSSDLSCRKPQTQAATDTGETKKSGMKTRSQKWLPRSILSQTSTSNISSSKWMPTAISIALNSTHVSPSALERDRRRRKTPSARSLHDKQAAQGKCQLTWVLRTVFVNLTKGSGKSGRKLNQHSSLTGNLSNIKELLQDEKWTFTTKPDLDFERNKDILRSKSHSYYFLTVHINTLVHNFKFNYFQDYLSWLLLLLKSEISLKSHDPCLSMN